MSSPVQIKIAAVDPDGFSVEIALQGENSQAALSSMAAALSWLKEKHYTPGPPASNGSTPAASDQAGPPICQYHGEMKRSKHFDGWYCPNKMGDGSYCKEQVKD